MKYNPVVGGRLLLADGKEVEIRRAGLYPTVFTSADGDVFEVQEADQFIHSKAASVRVAGRTTPVKYLVADAWIPNWTKFGESIAQHEDADLFDVRVENLHPATQRGRGRPRGGTINKELEAVEVARILGSLEVAADELGLEVEAVAKLVLKWIPASLLDFEDVPNSIRHTSKYKNLKKRKDQQ